MEQLPDHRESSLESFEFIEGNFKGKWEVIPNPISGGHVELESFESNQAKGDKILFIPGMPGDSVGWVKERYLDELLKHGYNLSLLRHCGLRIKPGSEAYVANKSREDRGGIIGKEKVRMRDWFDEVKAAIEYFDNNLDEELIVVSHSLGGLAVANALLGKGGGYEKVKKWVNLSGATISGDKVANPDFVDNLKNYIDAAVSPLYDFEEGSDPSDDILNQSKILDAFFAEGKKIDKTAIVSVYPRKDNLVDISHGENVHDHLRTGLLIDDNSVKSEEYEKKLAENPFLIHDYPHLQPATLVKLLDMELSKHPHRIQVTK